MDAEHHKLHARIEALEEQVRALSETVESLAEWRDIILTRLEEKGEQE